MREVAISEFKAKCLSLVDEVQKTRQPLRITRFGKPVAEVVPPSTGKASRDWFGSLAGKVKIKGDLIAPVIDMDEVEAFQD